MTDSLLFIPKRWLLWVYGIVPLALAVYLVDQWFLSAQLLPFLGLSTLLLPLYLVFFELPHIIASLLGFVDRSYVRHYRWQLLLGLPLLIGSVVTLWHWNREVVILLYVFYTMYHVIKQIGGIGLLLGAGRTLVQRWWVWSLIISTSLAFGLVIYPGSITDWLHGTLSYLVLLSCLAATVLGGVYAFRTEEPLARSFIVATVCLFLASYFLILEKYIFLSFFMIRFVHDISAFLFYVTHEHNRNSDVVRNGLYYLKRLMPFPVYLQVLVISIGGAFLIRTVLFSTEVALMVMLGLAFAHYYLEGIMWKRNSPHRQYVRLQ